MTALSNEPVMGATVSAAGYGSTRSWTVLVVIIAAALLPSVIMILRSTSRRRAGPEERLG